mmetsp:Transcript_29687/g.50624  ORF Transcript_29687/g.50624 Transcript_29687/m.50624 type:complete len:85 (-) Transcript_29687:161-415(-)
MILCRTWELPNLMMMSASPQTLTQPPPARHEAVIRSLRCIYTLNPSIDFDYIVWTFGLIANLMTIHLWPCRHNIIPSISACMKG